MSYSSPKEFYKRNHPIDLGMTTTDDCVNMMERYAAFVLELYLKNVINPTLLNGLKVIKNWSDEEDEEWDDQGHFADHTIKKFEAYTQAGGV
jgi:hypothetical protein